MGFDKLFRLHEHGDGAAGGVVNAPFVRREHLKEQPHDAGECMELPAILALPNGELSEHVSIDCARFVRLIDAADEVPASAFKAEIGGGVCGPTGASLAMRGGNSYQSREGFAWQGASCCWFAVLGFAVPWAQAVERRNTAEDSALEAKGSAADGRFHISAAFPGSGGAGAGKGTAFLEKGVGFGPSGRAGSGKGEAAWEKASVFRAVGRAGTLTGGAFLKRGVVFCRSGSAETRA